MSSDYLMFVRQEVFFTFLITVSSTFICLLSSLFITFFFFHKLSLFFPFILLSHLSFLLSFHIFILFIFISFILLYPLFSTHFPSPPLPHSLYIFTLHIHSVHPLHSSIQHIHSIHPLHTSTPTFTLHLHSTHPLHTSTPFIHTHLHRSVCVGSARACQPRLRVRRLRPRGHQSMHLVCVVGVMGRVNSQCSFTTVVLLCDVYSFLALFLCLGSSVVTR